MAWSLLAHTAVGSSGGGSVTTGNLATSGADFYLGAISDYQAAAQTTLSDSLGFTWSPLTAYTVGGGVSRIKLFYNQGGSGGAAHNFTANATGTAYPSIAILAFSGSATSPIDGQNGAADGAGTSPLQPGDPGTTTNGDLLVTAIGINNGTSYAIDNSFTITDTLALSPNNYFGIALAWKVQVTAAAINPAWSWSGSSFDSAAIAAFKAGAGVTGPTAAQISPAWLETLLGGTIMGRVDA